jgi:hypothetical protein
MLFFFTFRCKLYTLEHGSSYSSQAGAFFNALRGKDNNSEMRRHRPRSAQRFQLGWYILKRKNVLIERNNDGTLRLGCTSESEVCLGAI